MTTLHGPPLESLDGTGALTLGGFLAEVGQKFRPNEALVFDDPLRGGATVRWTYDQLVDQARRVARALLADGIAPGERVAILMGNRPEAVAGLFGAALAGAVAVPLSTFSTDEELTFLLANSEARVLLTQTRLLGKPFATRVPPTERIARVGDDSYEQFLAGGDAVDDGTLDHRAASVTPDDDGLIIYSSGTTSEPKGVLHAHRSPALQFWVQARLFGRTADTRMWTALPMFWTAGLNTAMGSTLAAGGCWVMQETFEAGPALALMARERVTEPYALPHQTGALAEHPDWLTTDLSSLRCVFGKSAFARHPSVTAPDTSWNMPVGWGLSETCAFFVAHPSDAPRELLKQSMGRPLPGNQLRVVDPDTGRVLGLNEDGELVIKGPTLMKRYLGRTAEECFDADGFFHTGDAGFVDADGYVHFTGRRTEMIKTGGANVSPAELEVALRACPPVKLARIIGMADARLDEIVVACIILKDGADATEDDIRSFLRDRVAAYKVPKRVLFFAEGEIPMTGSDTKVRDADLVAIVEHRLSTSGAA